MLLRSQFHPYQKYASDFITSHPQAAVLLDCGCGKTVITLTAISDKRMSNASKFRTSWENYSKGLKKYALSDERCLPADKIGEAYRVSD